MNISDMRAKRAAVARDLKAMMDSTPADKWTAEHNDKYDAAVNEIDALDEGIVRFQKVLDMTADKLAEDTILDAAGKAAKDKGADTNFFAAWAKGGKEGLAQAVAAAGPMQGIQNTMDTTTGADGGYTVQSSVVASILEALKAFGGMRQVATIITTDGGNPINYPTSDGTTEMGELVGQNAQASSADPTFGTLPLPVYKYSSKVVTVPIELIQDSLIDIQAFVVKRLSTRLGRILNNHFTLGNGTTQPNGIITAANTGKTGLTGQTTTLIYDDLIDLIHSIDPAYRELGNCRFMLNDATLKVLRKMKDTTGRPLWVPYEAVLSSGISGSLCGYDYTVNQDMAVMAANAKSVAFGDFSFYTIRDVMQMTFYRFDDSAYASKGQVGFLAFLRSGGNFMDVGGSVKLYVNSAT